MYDASARQVRHCSDKANGPTAETDTVDPLEFLARVTAHIPNKLQVMTRYYGHYANRVRRGRRAASRPAHQPASVSLHAGLIAIR